MHGIGPGLHIPVQGVHAHETFRFVQEPVESPVNFRLGQSFRGRVGCVFPVGRGVVPGVGGVASGRRHGGASTVPSSRGQLGTEVLHTTGGRFSPASGTRGVLWGLKHFLKGQQVGLDRDAQVADSLENLKCSVRLGPMFKAVPIHLEYLCKRKLSFLINISLLQAVDKKKYMIFFNWNFKWLFLKLALPTAI